MNDTQRKKEQYLASFYGENSWRTYFEAWNLRVRSASADIRRFHRDVRIKDPANAGRVGARFAWWHVDSLQEKHVRLQQLFSSRGGRIWNDDLEPYMGRQGQETLANNLWAVRSSSEDACAVLTAASVFSRENERGVPATGFQNFRALKELAAWANSRTEGKIEDYHRLNGNVLPIMIEYYEQEIVSFETLVQVLGDEHVQILSEYCPVRIIFGHEGDPQIEALVKSREIQEEEEERRLRVGRLENQPSAANEDERRREEEELKSKHPRHGEWKALSEEELRELVWSHPTTHLVALFGVSDSAIAKRCRKLGIRKPPLGFWTRVKAGKVPHPGGKPI